MTAHSEKGVVRGVCALWSVAGLAKTEKRKTRANKTKGSKRYVIARG